MRHSLRHRPDHVVVGDARGPAADLLQALNTDREKLTTIEANNATPALSRLASCATQARNLPCAVMYRGVMDALSPSCK